MFRLQSLMQILSFGYLKRGETSSGGMISKHSHIDVDLTKSGYGSALHRSLLLPPDEYSSFD